jgi:hypothetical protein
MVDRDPGYSADWHLAPVSGSSLSARRNSRLVDRSIIAVACTAFLETGHSLGKKDELGTTDPGVFPCIPGADPDPGDPLRLA